MKYELDVPIDEKTEEDDVSLPPEEHSIAEQLTQRGITETTARKFAKIYPVDRVQRQIEVFDWLKERKGPQVEKNPAGFLRKSIEED